MEELSDDSLVIRAKKGDVDAFAFLVDRYYERIHKTVYWLAGDSQDADDLVQEASLKAFRKMKTFNRRSGFYTWFYRVAVNEALNFLRKREREKRKKESYKSLSREEILPNPEGAPEKHSLRRELRNKLQEALDSLPSPIKVAFVLVVFQGMSHSQASDVLGCSAKTVSWRMHCARKLLGERLHPYLERSQ